MRFTLYLIALFVLLLSGCSSMAPKSNSMGGEEVALVRVFEGGYPVSTLSVITPKEIVLDITKDDPFLVVDGRRYDFLPSFTNTIKQPENGYVVFDNKNRGVVYIPSNPKYTTDKFILSVGDDMAVFYVLIKDGKKNRASP